MPAVDILIRGGGPVGATLALALRGSGLRVVLAERRDRRAPRPAFRPIALSYASRLILERVGAWRRLAPTPIETILVSQAGRFGRTRLEAAEAGVPALGYVVDYAALVAALDEQLAARGIESASAEPGALEARCTVHAEGAAPEAGEKRYGHDAVVAVVRTDPPARTTAYERFTPQGPLAALPAAGRYAVVWAARPERARDLAAAPQAWFLESLAHAAGERLGRPVAVDERSVQPIALRVRPSRIGARAVYVGNAAQTLHPVAGQGLNLGLRDAWDLAEVWREARDPGDAATLERFAQRRRLDAAATIRVTDLLAGAFLGSGRLAGAVRGCAMTALDLLPPARRFFARRMIYGASAIP